MHLAPLFLEFIYLFWAEQWSGFTTVYFLVLGSAYESKRNIFLGIRQLFTNIASSRVIQWIPAKQKFLPQKVTHSNAA